MSILFAGALGPTVIGPSWVHAQQGAAAAPVQLTPEADRVRMLRLLGLGPSEMRPAPVPDAKASDAANYDESKANRYPNLPDPLVSNSGHHITEPKEWWTVRRPEILADFEEEILGKAPEHLPTVRWQTVSFTRETIGGVPVVSRRLAGHVENSIYPQITVTIDMQLVLPEKESGRVPVLMELAFANDYATALQRPLPQPLSPATPGQWGVDMRPALQRGWGFAALNPASFQADSGSGLTQGIIGLMDKGQPRTVTQWGTLRAWAWGASRALDYLATVPAVDARRVGLVGHSRFGKAVLVTMAYDPRFAIAYSSSSGEGGAKLYRHIYGEQMENLASPSLYHWFCGNFLRYGGPLTPKDLPVDNHELIALAAPRPVFIGAGANTGDGYANPGGDAWADPRGMFLAEVAAGPVYRLLGAKDLGATAMPPVGTAVATGALAFRQHPYGHTPAPNLPAFLEFAAGYLGRSQTAPVPAHSNSPSGK